MSSRSSGRRTNSSTWPFACSENGLRSLSINVCMSRKSSIVTTSPKETPIR